MVLARSKYAFIWVLVVHTSPQTKMLRMGILFTFLPFFYPIHCIRVRLKLLNFGICTWHLNLLCLYKCLKSHETLCKCSHEKSSLSLCGLHTESSSFGQISQTWVFRGAALTWHLWTSASSVPLCIKLCSSPQHHSPHFLCPRKHKQGMKIHLVYIKTIVE